MIKLSIVAGLLALSGIALAGSPPASLFFVANEGQWEEPFAFKANVGNAVYYITPTGMTLDIREYSATGGANLGIRRRERERFSAEADPQIRPESEVVRGHVLRFTFLNANPSPEIIGEDKLSSYSNYFLGRDSCKWRSFVGHYQTVRMKNVWPGIDVVQKVQSDGVETVYRVQVGANAAQISIQVEGLTAPLRVDGAGNLILSTSFGEIKEKAPFAYQIIDHRQVEVPVRFHALTNNSYGLSFEAIDAGQELVIDPQIYSTFFAGAYGDYATGMDVDSAGNVVLCGVTLRNSFPTTPGAYQETSSDFGSGFVSKLNNRGTEFMFSTYFRGGREQFGHVRVDHAGSIYYVTSADTSDWPLTPDAFDTVAHREEIGIARLSADGSRLEFGSYLGGAGNDNIRDCALDSIGRLCICGETDSPDFPTSANALFRRPPQQGYCTSFATVFDPRTSSIFFSTFFTDSVVVNQAGRIVPLSTGRFWIIIYANGLGMPVTADALQRGHSGHDLTYFALVDFILDSLLYGSYLGSTFSTFTDLIPLDSDRIWLVGNVDSIIVPMPPGGFASAPYGNGGPDCFVMELLLPDSICHATFVAGPNSDYAHSAARAENGSIVVAGMCYGDSFPTTADAFSRHHSGGTGQDAGDLIVFELSSDLSTLQYGTYFGGSMGEQLYGSSYERNGILWLTGWTYSVDFPISPNPLYRSPSRSFVVSADFSGQSVPNPNRPEVLDQLTLSCFPNPFNPTTTVSFSLPKPSPVQLDVYDILGRAVYRADLGQMNAGAHQHLLNLPGLASGTYIVRLSAGPTTLNRKMMVLK